MRLDPDEFNAHLAHMGQSLLWRKSSACPCISEATGSPKQNCPHCGGKGRWWDQTGAASIAGAASQKIQREWAGMGMWESGDIVMTIPSNTPMYDIAPFDRVSMTDSSEPFSHVLLRGSDKLVASIVTIDRVYWLEGDAVVAGGIPIIDATGAPVWATGGPPAGRRYTITGRQRPEYFAFRDFAQDRSAHYGARLPRRIVLRKWDLFGRQ